MQFKTDMGHKAGMSSLQGYINIEKRLLVKLLGEPEDFGPGDKVMNEWCLEITDNNGESGIVTIYDWKNYDLSELPDDYSDWHVGGHTHMAPQVLGELLTELAGQHHLPKQVFRLTAS